MRGTFGNTRLKNKLVPGSEGGVSRHFPEGTDGSVYDVAMRYQKEKIPTIVLAGLEYGTGSSRDWAAKGTLLLGCEAVIARSFEHIHRSNLVGMGVLPLEFKPGTNRLSLGIDGTETFDVLGERQPRAELTLVVHRKSGERVEVSVTCRLDTAEEVSIYEAGGVLQRFAKDFLESAQA